jgi:hypothetical protein
VATVPSPRTWTAGELVTAAYMNGLRDALNFLLNPPVGEFQQTVAQSVATGSWTDLTFDGETIDSDNAHSTVTNTPRYTVQTPGMFQFSGGGSWALNASAVRRGARWSLNGAAVTQGDTVGPGVVNLSSNVVARTIKLLLVVGDFVTLQGFQDTGGALLTQVAGSQSSMSVVWMHA